MQNRNVLRKKHKLCQTRAHTAYWSMERAVAWAALSLSSAEFIWGGVGQEKRKKQPSLTCLTTRQQNWRKLVTLPLRWVSFLVFWSLHLFEGSSSAAYYTSLWCLSGSQSAPRFHLFTIPMQKKTELLCRSRSLHRSLLMSSHPALSVLSERGTQNECVYNNTCTGNTIQASAMWQQEAGQRKPVINITVSTKPSCSSKKKIQFGFVSVLYRCGGDTMHFHRTV